MTNSNRRQVRHSLRDYLARLYESARWRLVVTVLLAALCSLTEGVGIVLLIPTLQLAGMNIGGQGRLKDYAGAIDRALGWIGLNPSLPVLLTIFLLLVSARTLLLKLQMVAGAAVQQRLQVNMRERLHRAIVNADWLYLCRKKSSDLVHALTGEIDRIGIITTLTLMLAGEILVGVVYIIVAGALSPVATLLVLAAGMVLALLLHGRTRLIAGIGADVSRMNEHLYGAIVSHLQNLKAIKAYNAEKQDREVFAQLNSIVAATFNQAARRRAFSSGWFEIGSFAILSAAVYVSLGAFAVSPAGILILLLIFARLMPRLIAAYSDYQGIVNQLPAFDTITELENQCAAASEPSRAGDPVRLTRSIELKEISFSYPDRAVLNAVNLAIKAGQTVALVGPSGSGKSTLADLVIGLLRPDRGSIEIDGIDLANANLAAWRSQIGYVSQDTVLTHESLRANLKWARPDASEEAMWHALRLAAAEDLVRRLPDGLDTIVGDRGAFLSHGERQRIAIARALLRQPTLLVFDEATNSLDRENEESVLEAIDNLHGNLTILMISHRLSALRRADVVYLMEHGRIAQAGSWQSLRANRGANLEIEDGEAVAQSALRRSPTGGVEDFAQAENSADSDLVPDSDWGLARARSRVA